MLPKSLYKPKFIDKISLCSIETGEKTVASERRRKKHAGFWSSAFLLDFIGWIRWRARHTGDKACCLESRGGVHNFPRFGLGLQRKIIEPAEEAVCKTGGLVLPATEAKMKCQRNCFGPWNCKYFLSQVETNIAILLQLLWGYTGVCLFVFIVLPQFQNINFDYDYLVHVFFLFHDKMYKQGIAFAPLIGKYPHKLCYLIS